MHIDRHQIRIIQFESRHGARHQHVDQQQHDGDRQHHHQRRHFMTPDRIGGAAGKDANAPDRKPDQQRDQHRDVLRDGEKRLHVEHCAERCDDREFTTDREAHATQISVRDRIAEWHLRKRHRHADERRDEDRKEQIAHTECPQPMTQHQCPVCDRAQCAVAARRGSSPTPGDLRCSFGHTVNGWKRRRAGDGEPDGYVAIGNLSRPQLLPQVRSGL